MKGETDRKRTSNDYGAKRGETTGQKIKWIIKGKRKRKKEKAKKYVDE